MHMQHMYIVLLRHEDGTSDKQHITRAQNATPCPVGPCFAYRQTVHCAGWAGCREEAKPDTMSKLLALLSYCSHNLSWPCYHSASLLCFGGISSLGLSSLGSNGFHLHGDNAVHAVLGALWPCKVWVGQVCPLAAKSDVRQVTQSQNAMPQYMITFHCKPLLLEEMVQASRQGSA